MNEFNYDIISQYLAGELVGEELIAFEKKLQTNTALANEVQLYKTIETELYDSLKNKLEKENLTATLTTLGNAHFKKNEAKVVAINKRWWYAAAAVAAAVILFFILMPNKTKTEPFNNETLFAGYVAKSVDELSFGQRGKNDSLLIKAASLYNKKEYATVLPILENEIADNPNETQLILATGVCYMQTGQYNFAINFFDQIANGKTAFASKAQWYKALVLLKQNKLADCKLALQQIPNNADDYASTVELLKKIEKR
jgi:tetratricopeptide (TPR) repeat protein